MKVYSGKRAAEAALADKEHALQKAKENRDRALALERDIADLKQDKSYLYMENERLTQVEWAYRSKQSLLCTH